MVYIRTLSVLSTITVSLHYRDHIVQNQSYVYGQFILNPSIPFAKPYFRIMLYCVRIIINIMPTSMSSFDVSI